MRCVQRKAKLQSIQHGHICNIWCLHLELSETSSNIPLLSPIVVILPTVDEVITYFNHTVNYFCNENKRVWRTTCLHKILLQTRQNSYRKVWNYLASIGGWELYELNSGLQLVYWFQSRKNIDHWKSSTWSPFNVNKLWLLKFALWDVKIVVQLYLILPKN